ncbi:AMP-dependent synthetase/ligase [Streptomyces sp. NPDC049577]|uniref:AMP-dependent synthetase/ligase n=1 Tax=Streptomyces sp. NPDC049577 TaxID=3155153 RepID=UPI00343D6B55
MFPSRRAALPLPVPPRTTAVAGVVREAAVPPLVPPAHGSLGDLPFDNAAEAPTDVVLGRKQPDGGWRDVTAATFAAEVMGVAKGLIAHGLRPGDRLGLMSRTRYEWTLLDFAAWAAGLVPVPLYPTSSAEQVRWILKDSGAAACVVESAEQARLVERERADLPGLTKLWRIDAGCVPELVEAGRELPGTAVADRRAARGPEDIATLVYTSGTTGRPKGCVLTHANFLSEADNANHLLQPVYEALTREPASTLLFLPLSHVFGRTVAIGCLRARVRLGHTPSMRAEDLLADLAGFRPTFLAAVPYVLEKVYNTGRATAERQGRAAVFDRAASVARRYGEACEARRHGTGSGPGPRLRAARTLYEPLVYRRIRGGLGGKVRHVVTGGSPLGRRLGAFYAGAGIDVVEGYGLTETTGAFTVSPPQHPRLGAVGWPLPGAAVRIADDGEVLLRGDRVFAGYWDAERERAVAPMSGEWLPTGDLGALDEDGYLTITGRKKELIVTSGGKNVAPAPLEDRVRAHPLVSQCLVLGDDRPYVSALLTLDPDGLGHWCRMRGTEGKPIEELVRDAELLAAVQEAVDDANGLVSRAESIRRFAVLPVDFTVEAGHLTPSLKLRRPAIVRDFAAEIEALYEP